MLLGSVYCLFGVCCICCLPLLFAGFVIWCFLLLVLVGLLLLWSTCLSSICPNFTLLCLINLVHDMYSWMVIICTRAYYQWTLLSFVLLFTSLCLVKYDLQDIKLWGSFVKVIKLFYRRTNMYFNSTHHCLSLSNWGRLLALVSCYEDLMKPTMWWSSRPYDHMWTAWSLHEDWKSSV